jgi:hypothetical protein
VRGEAQLCRDGAALLKCLIHADPACFSLLRAFFSLFRGGPRVFVRQKDVSFKLIVKIRRRKIARNGTGK